MQIVDRYILRGFIQSLIYCILAFIVLYIIVDLFNYIDEMVRNRIPVRTIALYYAAFAPTIFVQTAPMAALLATIYSLGNLKRYNELTAMRVSGMSLWKVIKPLIYASVLLGMCVFVINDRVCPELAPVSTEIRENQIKEMGDQESTVIDDVAVFVSGNRLVYARSFDTRRKELRDIIVHQNDANQNLVMKVSAERGYWENDRWVFENGTTYRLDKNGYIIGNPAGFQKKTMDIKERPDYFSQKGRLPELMTYRQLRTYIDKFAVKSSSTTRKLLVDLYYKTSLPLVSVAVVLLAAPFAFMMQRGGVFVGFGVSMMVGVAFFGLQGICLALGKGGVLPPLASAWLANFIFIGAGTYFMNRCR